MGSYWLTLLKRVKGIISPESISEENKSTIKVIRVAFLFTLLTLCAVLLINLSWRENWINIGDPFVIIGFLVVWFFLERGEIQLSVFLLALVLDALATYGGTFGNGLHDIVLVIFPGTIILTSLILNRKMMIILNGLTILMVGWLGVSEKIISIPRPMINPGDPGDFIFVAIVLLVSSVWAMVISEQNRRNMSRIHHHAMHDYLTGLPNRALLFDRIDRIIRLKRRNPELKYAVLYIDLDGFKNVNDRLGHRKGDELIIAVANRIQDILRNSDTIARMGGDEFILLLSRLQNHEDALVVADRVQEELQVPFTMMDEQVTISASIGVVYGIDYDNADDLLIDADLAMYEAKKSGKAQRQVFKNTMRTTRDNEKIRQAA